MLAGCVDFRRAVVLHFGVYSDKMAAWRSRLATACYCSSLQGIRAFVGSCIVVILHLLCQPECVCSGFARLIWTQMQYQPRSLSGSTLSPGKKPSLARVKRYSGLLLRFLVVA